MALGRPPFHRFSGCLSLPFCFTHFLRPFSFAAALPALGAEGSDSSNAISDDLPFIGFLSTSICFYVSLYRFLFVSLTVYSFFAAALAALGAEGSDNSNAISGFFSQWCLLFFLFFYASSYPFL